VVALWIVLCVFGYAIGAGVTYACAELVSPDGPDDDANCFITALWPVVVPLLIPAAVGDAVSRGILAAAKAVRARKELPEARALTDGT
jgi:hypothetical protein